MRENECPHSGLFADNSRTFKLLYCMIKNKHTLQRLFRLICLRLVTSSLPFNNRCRVYLTKMGGVKLKSVNIFIGEGVIFDSLCPEEIEIGNHVHLTMNCIILTHNLDTSSPNMKWEKGHVTIGDNTFIGAGTIICNTVNIGKNVIVGAGSVVTKDIPDGEIWAGNPAHFIKNRK